MKPDKTFADYIAIAISPALIMAMVGSFVFFLLEISYDGEFAGRLRWTLFWFVLASVLISRISIEQGSDYASVYGVGLALATGLFTQRLVNSALGVWVLLAIIWWCVSKLTWDCTLIDEAADASGEGLLQVAGLDERLDPDAGEISNAPSAEKPESLFENSPKHGSSRGNEAQIFQTSSSSRGSSPSLLTSAATFQTDSESRPARTAKPKSVPAVTPLPWWKRRLGVGNQRKSRPHAPGLWVVYFSLAALPVFGLGQLLIASSDTARRSLAFGCLCVYVAAALGLLLTTSFLGLRRYLRQRQLQMPAAMAGAWIGFGTTLAIAILLLCILLPRPNAAYSLTAMVDKLGSPRPAASERALLRDATGEGEGQSTGDRQRDGTERSKGTDPRANEKEVQSGDGGRPRTGGNGKTVRQTSPGSPPIRVPDQGSALASLLKWILYGLFAAFIFRLLFRHGSRLVAALKELIQSLRDFLSRLLGSRQAAASRTSPRIGEISPTRPFAVFSNPFANGSARQMTAAELVRYSFEAMQAWAREQNCARQPQQTPLEFAQRLGEAKPELLDDARIVSHLYSLVAYAGPPPPVEDLESLERLWRWMSASAREAR